MKRGLFIGMSALIPVALIAAATLLAQQQPAEHQHSKDVMEMMNSAAPTSSNTASADEGGVFCPTMKTGQLCSHGTSDILQLSGSKRDQWIEAVRRYNKAVDAATIQLQEDAKTLLSPEQETEVQRWFAKGLNPQINKLLLARSAEKSK